MGNTKAAYQVENGYAGFEVRDYAPKIVAETEVTATREKAGSLGSRILSDYIFGQNQGGKKMALTAPVAEVQGAQVAPTAAVNASSPLSALGRFVIQFMMPAQFTLASLPAPLDDRIHFRQLPARRLAVLQYSGKWSEPRYLSHLHKLRTAITDAGLKAIGEPGWARYVPPMNRWFLRTNEVQLEVRA